ncbi:branched-chain-amino-acid aminotransferase [Deinococcus piscis]|uniref:branched-chain-amino-acid transaminase n=1 Tax=Deinococcus piscis TaxID=394230 RepID=A0ABQ3K9K8_9DEIO|nr:branched-chain amino acid aminotransferase [Deinococcus piscis]GHG01248.1 branched-chain-amino-acid aminotransferase [Deinococcus piscis]
MTGPRPTTLEDAATLPAPTADTVQGRYLTDATSQPRSAADREHIMQNLRFGADFSDHMASARWTADTGWSDLQLLPYGPIPLDPSANVLHYAQEVFEGLKAYRHADGSIWLFRPMFNAGRLAASCRRMALPELPAEDFLASLVDLIRTDHEYVPHIEGGSLYLRPFIFGDGAGLGVKPSTSARYLCIASPSGPYFKNGFAPVSIWVTQQYHRAGPGGIGAAKTGGNYAASLLPQQEAQAQGYEQVCYLDSVHGTNLEELGGMNVFVVRADGKVQTPRLTGTILEGGTRSSIIQLLRDAGRQVEETAINFSELAEDIRRGAVTEMFACGTAAVVTPIGRLGFEGGEVELSQGTVTQEVYGTLTGIQYGRVEDRHGWMYRVM